MRDEELHYFLYGTRSTVCLSSTGYVLVQSLSRVRLFATAWTAACQASLFFAVSWSLLKLTFIESVMPSIYLILCHPLLLLSSIFPSIRVFSSESALHIRWPKYWSFSFNPSNEYSGLISFRIDWFDLLAVQGTLKSLHQHHSLKASILEHLVFFMVQLLHLYMTTGKTIAFDYMDLCQQSNVLLFNTLSRFVIAFLLRSRHLSISWLHLPFQYSCLENPMNSMKKPPHEQYEKKYGCRLFQTGLKCHMMSWCQYLAVVTKKSELCLLVHVCMLSCFSCV